MSDRFDTDELLRAVTAARPAPAPEDDADGAVARAVLDRLAAGGTDRSRSGRPRAGRLRPALLPALGVLIALGVGLLAIVGLDHHRSTQAAAARSHHRHGAHASRLTRVGYADALGVTGSGHVARLLFDADQALDARCMSARGLHFVVDSGAPVVLPAGRVDLASITGLPTTWYPQPIPWVYSEPALLAEARYAGFGIHLGAVAGLNPVDPNDGYVKQLSPARRRAWIRALDGHGGCMDTAAAQLYGSSRAAGIAQTAPTQVYDTLGGAVYARNGSALRRGNPRIARAVAAWSRCMRRATGDTYADETALINALFASGPAAERTPGFARTERADAVADVRCDYTSGQASAFAAAFHAAANRLPARLTAEVRFVLAHRAGWVARARTVLAVR